MAHNLKPQLINNLIPVLEGVRLEARGYADEILITSGRVLHRGEVVMQAAELLDNVGRWADDMARVIEVPKREASEVACA